MTQLWTVLEEARLVPGFGPLLLVGDGEALTEIWFAPHHDRRSGLPARALTEGRAADADPVLRAAAGQLVEFFGGTRREFDLPLRPAGTAFQLSVWEALREIPYGTTTTYGAIAARLGLAPGASRAVGLANGANPLPVVVPCHRVVGADGSLTGFGGGLARKRVLLGIESAQAVLF